MAPIVQLWEFKDKGQKTEDRGWWLLNAKRIPAQSFVFCPLSFVLQWRAVELSTANIQFQCHNAIMAHFHNSTIPE